MKGSLLVVYTTVDHNLGTAQYASTHYKWLLLKTFCLLVRRRLISLEDSRERERAINSTKGSTLSLALEPFQHHVWVKDTGKIGSQNSSLFSVNSGTHWRSLKC